MKKYMCICLSVLMVLCLLPVSAFAFDGAVDISAMELSKQIYNDEAKCKENTKTDDIAVSEIEELAEVMSGITEDGGGETANLFALSYYPGTDIPTYTSVTGKKVLESGMGNNNVVYYVYDYIQNDYSDYLAALIRNGWKKYSNDTDYTNFTITYYYVKDGVMVGAVANVKYDYVQIMYARPEVAPTGVTLDYSSRTMITGNTLKLTATVIPDYATDTAVTWSSSNTTIATVSAEGTVTAKKAGTATITATTSNGKKATCSLTVKDFKRECYTDTETPTYTCVTGVPLMNTINSDGTIMYIYDYDAQDYVDYEFYLMLEEDWELYHEGASDDGSFYMTILEKGFANLVLVANFEMRQVHIYHMYNYPNITANEFYGKITVVPENVPIGSVIAYACYEDDILTEMNWEEYDGMLNVFFYPEADYDEIKVFVWESMGSMSSLCSPAIIEID